MSADDLIPAGVIVVVLVAVLVADWWFRRG